eukprot:s3385_g4.t1
MCMLLDYENRFCTKELKPMPRTFFAYPAQNPAHQFKYFSQLVAWGLTFLNLKADWDEFDDPTTVMTSMQVSLKDAGIQLNYKSDGDAVDMAAAVAKKAFSSLPEDVQEQIREKQRQAQAKKKAGSAKKSEDKSGPRPLLAEEEDRTSLHWEEFDPRIIKILLVQSLPVVGCFRDGSPVRLSSFNYFLFDGTDKQIWDPIFLARLAYEGFFTITTGGRSCPDLNWSRERIPLPELQPYYGVLDWKNFNQAKPVKKALKRVQSEGCPGCKYYLYCNRNLKLTYQGLNQYHKDQNGENWMTWKYLEAFKAASDNPKINFRLHSIEP